ncbi:MAG: YbhN family protein [Planctomycetales bacterium]
MSSTPPSEMRGSDRSIRRSQWIRAALKWGVFLLIVVLVTRHGMHLWDQVDRQRLVVRWGWFSVATLASVAGWLPSVWFWRKLITALVPAPPWRQVVRAYYCGHPGKYVPGKAVVIAIRGALLRPCGVPYPVSIYTVTLETLTCMAAGVVTMVLLLPWILAALPRMREFAETLSHPASRLGLPLAAVVASLAGLAVLNSLSRKLGERLRGTAAGFSALERPIPVRTLALGLVLFLAGWWFQGATLGLTLQALSSEPVDWSHWPHWTAAATASTVGGFVALFAPGGLGVREGLVMELLEGTVGPKQAVAAALLWRATALTGEVGMAVLLYFAVRPPQES